MRYYDLDISGKVKGSYAVQQPDKELVLLEDAPDDASKWDGKWVPDPDILATKAAVEAKAKAVVDAKIKVGTLSADVDKATDIESLKKVVLDLINQVKIITEV
jgi:hypothetical protein